ncbi:MAG: RagB/SusD family nutrient uptake outer membrane protein, partial [Tidjanibacter sp.]|nr:RagB/SusD family nutrient uptake outer membrane protein [Tidjanibacter sp.]
TSVADHVLIRAEEAILIAAEAACRLKDWTNARTLLTELGTKRDSKYADRLAARQDSDAFNEDTTAALTPFSLMDEVLWQRRVELWGEATGRLYDLKRLNLGYTRSIDGEVAEPGDLRFTILLPQKEFDNNKALNIGKDQNPR